MRKIGILGALSLATTLALGQPSDWFESASAHARGQFEHLWERAKTDAQAQFELESLYLHGGGVPPQSDAQAVVWIRRAAEQGHLTSQTMLGMLYNDGRGVPQSFAQAAAWYRKAAEQGDEVGQAMLGGLYEDGRLTLNLEDAYFWVSLAAAQNRQWVVSKDEIAAKLTPAQRANVQARVLKWKPKKS